MRPERYTVEWPGPTAGQRRVSEDRVLGTVRGTDVHRGETDVAVSANLAKLVDKEWEDKSLEERLKAPVSALAGVSEDDAAAPKKAFNVKTVGDSGKNKFFRAAQALTLLGAAAK
jgi:hypothetical protein